MSDLSHHDAMLDRIEELEAKLAKDAKAHEKELAVWGENYAALEAKLAEVTAEQDQRHIENRGLFAACLQTLAEAYTRASDCNALAAKLSDAEAELTKAKADAWYLDFQLRRMVERAEAAEAMLPRAYRAGVEAVVDALMYICAAYAACNGTDHPAYVEAQAAIAKAKSGTTLPTSAELLAQLKETE